MKNEITLYRRKNSLIRVLGLLIARCSFFTTIIFIVDSLYNNQKLELDVLVFPIILIILGIYIYIFTGYTKEILVSYNQNGFNAKNIGFTEWKQLKNWTLETKEKKDDSPFTYENYREFREKLPFPLDLFVNVHNIKTRKNTLKIELVDERIISFSDDEVGDIFKFIIFLRKNFQKKQKGNFKIW